MIVSFSDGPLHSKQAKQCYITTGLKMYDTLPYVLTSNREVGRYRFSGESFILSERWDVQENEWNTKNTTNAVFKRNRWRTIRKPKNYTRIYAFIDNEDDAKRIAEELSDLNVVSNNFKINLTLQSDKIISVNDFYGFYRSI
jgi:hypothetical protein